MHYKNIQQTLWRKCGGKLKSLRVKVSDFFPGYPDLEIDEVEEANNAIAQLVSSGKVSATYDKVRHTYKTVSVSTEQLRSMFPDEYFKEDYDNVIKNVFAEFPDLTKDVSPKCITESFFNFTSPESLTAELRNFFNACYYIKNLEEDRLLRIVSIQQHMGSKGLDKKAELILRFLLPKEYEEMLKIQSANREYVKTELLKKLHIIKGYQYVTVKGKGIICTKDGEIHLDGYGNDAVQLSSGIIEKIQDVVCDKVLTIENMTTFNDYPYDIEALVVYVGGFMDTVTEKFLAKINAPFLHSGDLDAYGFDILHNMEQRLCRSITPYMMDLKTYEHYNEYAIDITPDNIAKMQECTGPEKELFARLMQDGKILEQEAFSVRRQR